MEEFTYVVDNTDTRTVLIKNRLKSIGKTVVDFGSEVKKDIRCVYILSPKIKLVNTENINSGSKVYCFFKAIENDKNIAFFNLQDNESFACQNAVLTAEGVLSLVIKNTPFSLKETKLLVLGFGRCGKALAEVFKNLCSTTVYVTSEKNINILQCLNINYITKPEIVKNIKNFNVIVNTIPDLILDKDKIDKLDRNCFVFDIASNKGGVDFDYADKLGIYAKQFLALPSEYCPLTAFNILYKAIFNKI